MKKWQLTIRWVPVVIALVAAGAMLRGADVSADARFDNRVAPRGGYRVVVADLDLQSARGMEALYSRLQTAAREVCGFDQARGYAERRRARRCIGATLDAVMAELGQGTSVSGRLTARHRAGRNRVMDAERAERFVKSSTR